MQRTGDEQASEGHTLHQSVVRLVLFHAPGLVRTLEALSIALVSLL